jgi:hypothetical protein
MNDKKQEAKKTEEAAREEKLEWIDFKSVALSKDKKRLLIFLKDGKAVSVNVGLIKYVAQKNKGEK